MDTSKFVIDNDYNFRVKYYSESDNCKTLVKATVNSAGDDLYAAEDVEILRRSNAMVSLDLRIAIPTGFFGKIFSKSGLFMRHKITAEAGVIVSDYRGVVYVLLFNHSDEKFSVRIGQRIAQVLFLKILMLNLIRSKMLMNCQDLKGMKMDLV